MPSSAGRWRALRKVLQRKRVFAPDQLDQGGLRRCLGLRDLWALGVGSTLGVGVYVVVGAVALQVAGPAILLSFLIAAIASLLAGLCYAELGARVPRAGSAYIYTYVTVGELLAFLIGWNMLLEGIVGTASVAKGLSTYLDSMFGGAMSRWLSDVTPMGSPHLSPYFDLFAFSLVLLLGVLLSIGVRQSSSVNNVCATLHMLVLLFIIVAGAIKADMRNWSIPEAEVPSGFGSGGFLPYGGWGVLRGAALCFYGFVGFDVITHTGEEVVQPRRSIPVAILAVLAVVCAVYAAVGSVLTLMVPYYDLDKAAAAALAAAFTSVGWDWARWIVSIGAVFGICTSLYGCMFPVPRLLYAMSSDGLLPRPLALLSGGGTPATATLLPAAIIAVLAGCLDLEQLIVLMCVGTLLSYTIVAACVLVLRYRCKPKPSPACNGGALRLVRQALGCGQREPCRDASTVASGALLAFMLVCVATALVGVRSAAPLLPAAVLHGVALVLLLIISVQPQAPQDLAFKTPLVPLVPCLSIYVNIQLMILVNVHTWIRVLIWMAVGLPVYIICLVCYKRNKADLEGHAAPPDCGKPSVHIIVETATPPDTLTKFNAYDSDITYENNYESSDQLHANIPETNKIIKYIEPYIADEIIVQQAVIENHHEKEAKIIDLLDQVLQAEEDNYADIVSLKETREDIVAANNDDAIQRKSLSELSDAGSDASGQVQSKYDVIALVHREDLPRLNEEDHEFKDCYDNELIDIQKREMEDANNNIEEKEIDDLTELYEQDSETNSRTDESGYSDTLDRYVLNDSIECARESPVNIPEPPPLDENYFASPKFKKAHTISSRPSRKQELELELHDEESKPRESVLSNTSQDNDNIVFGSERQMSFMSKLNNIFQTKISAEPDDKLKRSNSTGNFANEGLATIRERPAIFLDLKKELMAMESAPNLRPINGVRHKDSSKLKAESVEDVTDSSLSREDLKSKLESILATGGPPLVKPRVMKSNPPTPEEAYQTDSSSTESIPKKLPKTEKNDTLKRQKDKFGEVLNSLRLSLNKDEIV